MIIIELKRAAEIAEKCRDTAFLRLIALANTLEEQREVCEWAGVVRRGDETEFRYALSVLRELEDNQQK